MGQKDHWDRGLRTGVHPRGGSIMSFVFTLIVGVIMIIPFWKIFSKAGFSPLLAILAAIPIVNLIVFFYLAFKEWPALKGRQ
jgi:hypothetical protein